ncbi:MAG: GDP-mannose 4,6-dehydratase [Thaumarchaeota archaeon]|nr:GDP-mannose 4,6-dehydratase [Nitrososphaerota archaeon]
MNNILITGYGGFIGSHLVNKLSRKSNIVGVSNKIIRNPYVKKCIKKDIRSISVSDVKEDIHDVVHLAAITDVQYCQLNPGICFEVNVMGTQKMLEFARKKDSKFIYVSTSHVYGIPKLIPIKEDHPKNPTSIYAGSKLAGEICCESYAKTYGMDVSILRLFSVYGANSPQHLVISRIITQLKSQTEINLGNLSSKRDFVYIDDVIKAIELVIRKSKGFETFNVGTGESISIYDVCKIIQNITKKNFTIKSIPSLKRKVDVKNLVSNTRKIRKLGWKPCIDIHTGLAMTLQNHSEVLT